VAGVAPEDAVHAGDSVEHDVAGARAAGVAPVLVARHRPPTGGVPAGVPVIATLAGLPALAR
jgi:putative hydrolase of the HAD superfamily